MAMDNPAPEGEESPRRRRRRRVTVFEDLVDMEVERTGALLDSTSEPVDWPRGPNALEPPAAPAQTGRRVKPRRGKRAPGNPTVTVAEGVERILLTREEAAIAARISGATPAPLSLAKFIPYSISLGRHVASTGGWLAIVRRDRASLAKYPCRPACVSDPFLAWSAYRTVLLTIFWAPSLDHWRGPAEWEHCVVASNDENGFKTIRRVKPSGCV